MLKLLDENNDEAEHGDKTVFFFLSLLLRKWIFLLSPLNDVGVFAAREGSTNRARFFAISPLAT